MEETAPVRAIPSGSLNRLVISGNLPYSDYRGLAGRELVAGAILRQCEPLVAGRRIAALLFTLFEGSIWPDHPDNSPLGVIRSFWRSTPVVVLGGGILAGDRGMAITEYAKSALWEWAVDENRVHRAASPEHMPLLGALVGAPAGALGLDFGHGSLKASLDGTVYGPYRLGLDDTHTGVDRDLSTEVAGRIVGALRRLRADLVHPNPAELRVSVAAYLEDGHFEPNLRGAYCRLIDVEPDAARFFSRSWVDAGGEASRVEVYHDGMAAARLVPCRGAAIVFGTSAGHGFRIDG
jgi:hypothetical protein